MMHQEAIVHTLRINRMGERIQFQIRLPHDTKCIIGLEYNAGKLNGEVMISSLEMGFEGDTSFTRFPNRVIGRLSLQSSGCENLFYQGDLIEDRNAGQHEGIAALLYTPQAWIQSSKREEISFCIGSGLIEGYFQDSYGTGEYTELQYELSIYLWIEKCVS